jgi:nucleotide-binding universal stress UspA family protein
MIAQPIIVGVDGSPESASAASVGWMLARAADVKCQLVHAASLAPASFDLGSRTATEALELALLARARLDCAAALEESVPNSVIDAMLVRMGRAVDVLNDAIVQTAAPMIVLGGKHHSTLGRWLGGSTVQHVVRRFSVPLLVTAGALRARPRVLVAVDASYAAVPTAEQAIAFAKLMGGPLRALHVVEPTAVLAESIVPTTQTAYESRSRERIERDVWTILPLPDHSKVIRSGIALETIVQEAAAWRADVIVVGSHGKGWIDRLLIGSVTEDLLNNLPCAVLVIPVPAPDRREPAPVRQRTALALG